MIFTLAQFWMFSSSVPAGAGVQILVNFLCFVMKHSTFLEKDL